MKLSSIILSSSSLLLSSPSKTLAFSNPILTLINKVNPSINTFASSQESSLLNIRLDIGSDSSPGSGRIGIHGLLLELNGDQVANYPHPKLPGTDGPNPQLSSGAKSLSILREGRHIDAFGSNVVRLDHGAWEMIWRCDAPAGALIVGFDAGEIKRNQVSLPEGRVYLTFPLWTSESLRDLRERKAKAEEKAMEAMDRQKEEIRKMQETGNLISKALHFRNACKANEDLDYSGFRMYSAMNLDKDMIPLKGDLHLCSLGTVWTKKDTLFGSGDHVLLGTASVASGKRDELEGKKVFTERELKSVAFDGLRP
ncbi:hypothetical protein HJC23_002053 [Cyclotella cryptica]|uniref:Uncharacterized protein n=1 Tax=Cyclotella cryptica TaxID=29204 RepID=A0ABD3Q7V7_9STRA|eukprot:CCRYP_008284-RA/>CCRYP_008284-RA protein AED:0.03 eAED:0.03 QI:217/1/1/1/0/0/2/406/310